MNLLDQHIAETETALQQSGMADMMQAMQGQMGGEGDQMMAPPEMGMTAGQQSGGEIAGALGAMANPGGMQ
jgi:hypothetical protein